MTKKRNNNPFGIKGFNGNNPLGIKGYNPNNPLGIKGFGNSEFKIRKMRDPIVEAMKNARQFDKKYSISTIKIPQMKIEIPKIRLATPSRIDSSARTFRPARQPLTSIPARQPMPNRIARPSITQYYSSNRNERPIIDIQNIVEKLIEKRKMQQPKPQQPTPVSLIKKYVILNELSEEHKQQNSKIYEELAQHKKENNEIKEELSDTQEKINRLQKEMDDYKQMLMEAIKQSPSNPEGNPDISKLLDIVTSLFTQIENLRDEVSKYKKYQPDLEHLHRNNEDSANDIAK